MGPANISPDTHVAYALGAILFKSTVCIVLCCISGICLGVCSSDMSCAFKHVIHLRFSLRRGLESVGFPKNDLQLFNYGNKYKIVALWKNSFSNRDKNVLWVVADLNLN